MSKIIDRDRSNDCESPEVLTVLGINSKCVDLSWPFDKQTTVYWPGGKGFNHCVDCSGGSNINGVAVEGEHYASGEFSTAEHGGTHVDAPYHFARDGVTIERIRMKDLIAPCCIIDISSKQSAEDMNPENKDKFSLEVSDIEVYESQHGKISPGCIVLVRTGWSSYWMDGPANYLGYDEDVQGPFDPTTCDLSFPGVSPEAALVLITRKIVAVGVDTPSLDSGANSKVNGYFLEI
jgi:kynurenine formamidase